MTTQSKLTRFVYLASAILLMIVFVQPLHTFRAAAQQNTPTSPQDTPFKLISTGVTSYTIASPRLFWHTGVPVCPPGSKPGTTLTEQIQRTATYGWDFRTLYSRETICNQQDVISNIVSDGSYIYWMSAGFGSPWAGLVRLSVLANPGDMPQILTNFVTGPVELAVYSGTLYVLTEPNSPAHGALVAVDTTNGIPTTLVADAGAYLSELQTDGLYVYWNTNGTLNAYHTYYQDVSTIDGGVFGYFPEGYGVFYGKGNQVIYYSNMDNTYTPIYTSPEADTVFPGLVADGSYLFFFEKRLVPCSPEPCFPTYNYLLVRSARDGSSSSTIFVYSAAFEGEQDLKADGDFLFWRHEGGSLLRLPKNAIAMPMTNLRVTGLQVIQSIQDTQNTVLLVAGKRTFVRLFAKSDGPGDVAQVTARLF